MILELVIVVLQLAILVSMYRIERDRSREADADFRLRFQIIESERAARQRADLEADMERARDPFAIDEVPGG